MEKKWASWTVLLALQGLIPIRDPKSVLMYLGKKKKSLFNNHVLPTNSFASFSHILQGKEPRCMAWKGAAACQLYWLLGTSLCFMCSPTYCFSLCMGLGVKSIKGTSWCKWTVINLSVISSRQNTFVITLISSLAQSNKARKVVLGFFPFQHDGATILDKQAHPL